MTQDEETEREERPCPTFYILDICSEWDLLYKHVNTDLVKRARAPNPTIPVRPYKQSRMAPMMTSARSTYDCQMM